MKNGQDSKMPRPASHREFRAVVARVGDTELFTNRAIFWPVGENFLLYIL